MPLLTVEAEKLSNDDLRAGIVEEVVTSDQLFQIMPFKTTNGRSYVYNRESTLSEGDFVETNDNINEGAATFENINQKLKRIVGDVDVDDFLTEVDSDTNDQAGVQIAKKAKGVARKFARTMINGNETTTPKEFDGLLNLVTVAQTIEAGANGAALNFGILDALIDLVKIAGTLVFIMNSRTIRAYAGLCRALGGTTPEQVNMDGVNGTMTGYRGIPILKNDYLPVNQVQGGSGAVCTSIFLAALDEEEGVCGLMPSMNMGINVKVVGPVQNKDATRYRVRWYASLAMHSTLSLAMCKGINN